MNNSIDGEEKKLPADEPAEEEPIAAEEAEGETEALFEESDYDSIEKNSAGKTESVKEMLDMIGIVGHKKSERGKESLIQERPKKRKKHTEEKPEKRTLGVKKTLSPVQKGVLIASGVLLVFVIAAVIMYFSSGAGRKVAVVNVNDIEQFGGDMMFGGSYGTVVADNIQALYASNGERVKEIYVTPGQQVRAGDRILAYDSSLGALEVEKKRLEVSKKEQELANLRLRLAEIERMKPSVPTTTARPTEEHPVGDIVEDYLIIRGEGTMGDPYICVLAGTSIPNDNLFMDYILPGAGTAWVVFENRTQNRTDGRVNEAWGFIYTRDEGGATSIAMFDASGYVYTEPEPIYIDDSSGYTAEEIRRMRVEAQNDIKNTDLELRMAKAELAQLEYEMNSGVVLSKIDGVVGEVRSVNEAMETGMPVVLISGGGAFAVETNISELMLDTVSVGSQVSIMSYETGMNYMGTVQSIVDIPVEDDMYYYSEGAAASYYPAKITVEEGASLREYEYVSVNFDTSRANARYIESMFVLNENGASYVYVEGANGLLEKRRIVTGGTVYGYLTEVLDGLTSGDYIAVPYGNNVRSGAKVERCTLDEFYSRIYGY